MAEAGKYYVDWLGEADKPRFLEMNRREYGDAILGREEYFDWLSGTNPAGRPLMPVARSSDAGEVVAFAVYSPVRFRCCGGSCMALSGSNLLVAPEYRGLGITGALRQALNEEGRARGFSFWYTFPNAKSLAAHTKWGDQAVCPVPLAVRPLNIAALANARVRGALLRRTVSLGWEAAAATIWREPPRIGLHGLVLSEDSELDSAYDDFWERVKDRYQLQLVRDRTYLQWRFLSIPHRTYTVISARVAGDLLAYAVLREDHIRGTAVGLIADLASLPGPDGDAAGLALVREALSRFRGARLDMAGALMLGHSDAYALLRRGGFLKPPDRLAPQQFHLMAVRLTDRVPASVLLRPQSWHVSVADHDAA